MSTLRPPHASPIDRGRRTASPSSSSSLTATATTGAARSPSRARPATPFASLATPDAAVCAQLNQESIRLLLSAPTSRVSFDGRKSFERQRSNASADEGWEVSEDWGEIEASVSLSTRDSGRVESLADSPDSADRPGKPASSTPSSSTAPPLPFTFSTMSLDASLLALATPHRFIILKLEGSPRLLKDPDPAREYSVVGQGSGCEPGETISSILLVGVYKRSGGRAKSSNIQVFLAVGYSSGFLRIFSDNGTLLLSQPLHRRPLIRLSLRFLPRPALDDQEELLCLFEDRRAALIDGLGLMTALRMAEAGEEVPLLSFRKVWLQGQETIADAISIGPSPNTFAPILPTPSTASTGNIAQSVPSFTSRFLAVGHKPMVAYYCTSDREGFSLTNVASKVTSALGSIASSFFGRKPKEESKPDPAMELANAPARPVPTALFLSDQPRKLTSVVPAPFGGLAAATDNLGRVLLLDLDEGQVVRMWKGSRGAQVGWIEVACDSDSGRGSTDVSPRMSRENLAVNEQPARPSTPSSGKKRTALLLAIYLPRGVLEIHKMRHGPRIAQIAVPPNLKLIGTAHGALVLNQGGFKRSEYPAECVLVAGGGEVRVVRVPPGLC